MIGVALVHVSDIKGSFTTKLKMTIIEDKPRVVGPEIDTLVLVTRDTLAGRVS